MKNKEIIHTHREIALIFIIFVICIAFGAVFYYNVENHSVVDSFYLAAMTLTTVGYGDVTPQTDAGKLFTAFYSILGVGIFFGFANAIFHNVLVHSLLRRRQKDESLRDS